MVAKKGDGLQVKESTDSSTTLEDDEVKGEWKLFGKSFILNIHMTLARGR